MTGSYTCPGMPGPRRAFALRLPLLALVAWPATAAATQVAAVGLPELAREAAEVVVAEVGAQRARWADGVIVTRVELRVLDDWLHPGATRRIHVEQRGGTVGDLTMTVIGAPRFVTGQRALLFLRRPDPATPDVLAVLGMAQGLRPLRYEAQAGRWVVLPPDLTSVVEQGPDGAWRPVAPEAYRPVALDGLRAEVRRLRGLAP